MYVCTYVIGNEMNSGGQDGTGDVSDISISLRDRHSIRTYTE